jgi:hypothetical protein
VLKDDRRALTLIDTGHPPAFDLERFRWCELLAAVAHYCRSYAALFSALLMDNQFSGGSQAHIFPARWAPE